MNNQTPPPDSDIDDNELLDKFNGLLNKYQNQGQSTGLIKRNYSTLPTTSDQHIQPSFATPGTIPTLTEVVTLHPAVIQRQPKRSTPIQKLLDAALEEVGIDLPLNDRKALANALTARLIGKPENNDVKE